MKITKIFTQTLFFTLIPFAKSYCVGNQSYFDVNVGYKAGYYERVLDITSVPGGVQGELKINFNRLSMIDLAAEAKLALTRDFFFQCNADYGWIVHGDTRRATDVASLQVILQDNYQNDGHVANIYGAFGYTIYPFCNFQFSPLLGLGYTSQSLSVNQGGASIFSNKVNWIGPWIGFNAAYCFSYRFELDLEYGFHWVRCHDYHVDIPFGAASLDFKYDNAVGNTVSLDGVYHCSNCWRIGLGLFFERWHTIGIPTIDAVTLFPFSLSVQGEKDHWLSYAIFAKVGYAF